LIVPRRSRRQTQDPGSSTWAQTAGAARTSISAERISHPPAPAPRSHSGTNIFPVAIRSTFFLREFNGQKHGKTAWRHSGAEVAGHFHEPHPGPGNILETAPNVTGTRPPRSCPKKGPEIREVPCPRFGRLLPKRGTSDLSPFTFPVGTETVETRGKRIINHATGCRAKPGETTRKTRPGRRLLPPPG